MSVCSSVDSSITWERLLIPCLCHRDLDFVDFSEIAWSYKLFIFFYFLFFWLLWFTAMKMSSIGFSVSQIEGCSPVIVKSKVSGVGYRYRMCIHFSLLAVSLNIIFIMKLFEIDILIYWHIDILPYGVLGKTDSSQAQTGRAEKNPQ